MENRPLRILKPIAHFQAHDEKELYKKLCEIDWSTLVPNELFKVENSKEILP